MKNFDDLKFEFNKGFKTSKKDKSFFEIFKTDSSFSNKFRKGQRFTAIFSIIVFALLYYYIFLPPLNIRSIETWIYFGIIFGILVFVGGKSLKFYKIYRYTLFIGIILFAILKLPGLVLFQSRSYANIINIKQSNFQEDIEELPIDKIPTLDRDTTVKLGARKMGELIDLVSQFDIDSQTYTQINYQNKPVRVTPLKYNGFIKYIFNMSEGLPGYMMVDIVNAETNLVKLQDKIKISKQDYFFRDIYRYTRLRYPTKIFEEANFEIDDNGIPYWIIPTYKPSIFFFDALDVEGAIIVNATNGEHKYYKKDDIPQWIDRIYNADRIIEQLNWNGSLKDGYLNSIFAQKNVLMTTSGYNYLALDDDVYLYTGYTSVAADESNVGFVLSNLRTKETKFYPVSSAEESSAMESAEGEVQEKGYKSTFPLLLNIDGKPTYFLSLKDNAGLIKLYSFIDAQNYQNVSIGNTVEQAMINHLSNNTNANLPDIQENIETLENEGFISEKHEVTINGNTFYYFQLENNPEEIYIASINLSPKLPFNDYKYIKFKYQKQGNINNVIFIDSLEN